MSFGSNVRTGRSNIGFDLLRRKASGPLVGPFQQGVEGLSPLIFGVNGYQADLSLAQPDSFKRLQHSLFVDGTDDATHVDPSQFRNHTLFWNLCCDSDGYSTVDLSKVF
jgi:hypothetical protein